MRKAITYFSVLMLCLLIIPIVGEGQDSSPTTHEINVRNYSFSPAEIQIDIGDIVVFKWEDGSLQHNVEEVSNSKKTSYDSGFRSGDPENGPTQWTLPSTYTQENITLFYICGPHVVSHNMRGKIIVGSGSEEIDGGGGKLGMILAIFLVTGVIIFAMIAYLQKQKKSA